MKTHITIVAVGGIMVGIAAIILSILSLTQVVESLSRHLPGRNSSYETESQTSPLPAQEHSF